jgi:hypothetical protein
VQHQSSARIVDEKEAKGATYEDAETLAHYARIDKTPEVRLVHLGGDGVKRKSPAFLPGPPAIPYGQSGRFAATGPEVAGLLPAEPAALPLEPLIEPVEPVVLPEAAEPVFAAVFNRAWPVALSLQCVAAETLALLPADGDVLD